MDLTGAVTRLGRAVQATVDTGATPPAGHRERHRRTNWLRDVILGGQDGLVNILGIILGVMAGGGSTTVLLSAGFAAAITESISMGAVGYTSAASERDYYRSEEAREDAEIDAMPAAERQEVREIYAAKGFEGELLDSTCAIFASGKARSLQECHIPGGRNSEDFLSRRARRDARKMSSRS